ncbi:hypothetical protein RF11_15122 [Thelohanellus kitauei]|uniref:Uncharacterized protein n=1 Tax=Thelohanellus kitauei TaxID=669202 RepID=A0A0C2JVS7_THEKT|nr:hypothetical protein RF11_15122 [Thelohanellus kitauei]
MFLFVFLLKVIERSLEEPELAVAATEGFTSDVAMKIIKCFVGNGIRICQSKPQSVDIEACTKSNVVTINEISNVDLNQIFDKLFENRNTPRSFQKGLLQEMASRIGHGGDFQEKIVSKMEEIVKKIITDNKLAANDSIDVYCHFTNAVFIAKNVLEVARMSSNQLTLLIATFPKSDLEIEMAKMKAIEIKIKFFETIVKSIDSEKILIKPVLRDLINNVIKYEIDYVNNAKEMVLFEILKLLDAIEAGYYQPSLRESGSF